jgi:hypothetical protein
MAYKTAGQPMMFPNVEELEKNINEYFDSCWDCKRDSYGTEMYKRTCNNPEAVSSDKTYTYGDVIMEQVKPYTIGGLAVHLGTCTQTLINYEEKEKYFATIKKAKERIYAFKQESLYGKNAVGAMFDLKCNNKWQDKVALEIRDESSENILEILKGTLLKDIDV